MRDLRARSLKKACFIAALFSVMLSAAPAFAQTVTVMWDPSPASDQVTTYQVCFQTSSPCNTPTYSVGASTTFFTLTPTGGVRYSVAIRATNAAGSSAFSSEVNFSIPSFAQPPNQSSAMGTAITPVNLSVSDPDGSALTITHTGLPVGLSINSVTRQITGTPVAVGTYPVTLFVSDGLATVSRTLTWTVTAGAVTTVDSVMRSSADFDGDGRSDMWRYELTGSVGTWRIRSSITTASSTRQWGFSGDIPVPADYDGDGRADMTVFRPSSGQWFILKSSTNYAGAMVYQWGASGDIPLPADYDGDGRADLAIYRPSSGYWFILKSSTNYTGAIVNQWGVSSDIPVPADYDGDLRADLALFRPSSGTWFILKSSTNYTAALVSQWGAAGDIPLPADYDGDGRAEMTVYRPSNRVWFILRSSTNYTSAWSYQWGAAGDLAVPGDYDGDRRADIGIWRAPGYLFTSGASFTSWLMYQWGQ